MLLVGASVEEAIYPAKWFEGKEGSWAVNLELEDGKLVISRRGGDRKGKKKFIPRRMVLNKGTIIDVLLLYKTMFLWFILLEEYMATPFLWWLYDSLNYIYTHLLYTCTYYLKDRRVSCFIPLVIICCIVTTMQSHLLVCGIVLHHFTSIPSKEICRLFRNFMFTFLR